MKLVFGAEGVGVEVSVIFSSPYPGTLTVFVLRFTGSIT